MSEVLKRQIYDSYEKEMFYLQTRCNKLLQEIKQQETKMNRRKQLKLKPNWRSLNKLNSMVKKFLRMLAFIDTYGYFQMIMEPLSYGNQTFFYGVAEQYYEDILQKFLLKLKANQLRKDNFVDFVVHS